MLVLKYAIPVKYGPATWGLGASLILAAFLSHASTGKLRTPHSKLQFPIAVHPYLSPTPFHSHLFWVRPRYHTARLDRESNRDWTQRISYWAKLGTFCNPIGLWSYIYTHLRGRTTGYGVVNRPAVGVHSRLVWCSASVAAGGAGRESAPKTLSCP